MLASRLFYGLTIAFFSIQALWITFSALYPQAFDEDFHFGIIKIYAQHWLPFLSSQPTGANPYGAVARDPSYLYHYLMSFPYRVIAVFWHSEAAQVIALRIINVGLFVLGLWLFTKVVQRLGVPRWVNHIAIAIISFIPVMPQLAGQINYDNLLFPLSALTCLLTFSIIDKAREKQVPLKHLFLLASVCLLASIVKYEFLPIFLAVAVFVVVYIWRSFQGDWHQLGRQFALSWRQTNKLLGAALLVFFVASFGLFTQRDIGNVLQYHTLVPDCSEVLDIHSCSEYSVWAHDYTSHQLVTQKAVQLQTNLFEYIIQWIYWLWYRLFFAVNGSASRFQNFPPLPLPAAGFALAVIAGTVAVAYYGRRIFTDSPYLAVAGLVVLIYLLTLLGAGYVKYRQTAVLELMNGRYLLPILPLGIAVAAVALRRATERLPRPTWRPIAAALLLVCMVAGGGVFTFISRSDDTWYWHNPAVLTANHAAKRIFEPVLIDGPRHYSGSRWYFF